MNIKRLFFCLFFFMTINCLTQNEPSLKEREAQVAAAVFTRNMPTDSIHEKTIEKIYGPKGLDISDENLVRIKNSYCYLEFLVKIDKVKNDPQYALYKTTDFKDFMQPRADNKALMPTQTLVESQGWKGIKITAQDLIASTAWQNFIKSMICDSLDNDATILIDSAQTNNQMSPYLPNLEAGYNAYDFTSLRFYQESIQLQTQLQAQQRKLYLEQATDWKIGSSKILDAVAQFKKADFYKFTHNAQATQQTSNLKNNSAQAVAVPSGIPEQIVCYFMFLHIQTTIHDLLKIDKALAFLTQASASELSPNFFMYTSSDFVYINDMLMLEIFSDLHAKGPKNSAVPTPTQTLSDKKQPPTSSSALGNSQNPEQSPEEIQKKAAAIIFQKITSLDSKYESIINTIYGPSGLNVAKEQLDRIKKAYCYLEFLIKIDKVKNSPQYKQYQTTDFKDFITSNPGDGALMPTEALVGSAGWKAITYTDQEMVTSPAWQMFIKAMICDIYDNHDEFILDSFTINDQIVDDMANLDNYYTSDQFTQIRLTNENMQLHRVMLENQQKTYLEQCPDWKKLNQKDFIAAIEQFKKTDFYDLSHNSATSKSKDLAQKAYTSIGSPTKEQIVSYYTLLTVQTDIYNLITLENLSPFLTTASSEKLVANFFAYKPIDYVYFYDNLVLSNLIDANKDNLDDDPLEIDDTTDARDDDQVVIQSSNSALKKMNRATNRNLKKMNRATNRNLKKMNRGTRNSLRKMNRATARNVKKMNRIIAKRWKANEKLILAVIITVVIVVVVAALIVCSGGAASGIIPILMAPVNGLIWAGTAVAGAASTALSSASAAMALTVSAYATGYATGGVIGGLAAVGGLAGTSLVLSVIAAPLATVMMVTGAGITIAALADDKIGMKLMMGMMQGMEVMTEGLTTGFIELSVGLTFLGATIAQGIGYPVNAKQETAKVKAKMEKYRGTINIVMSVVLTILITVVVMVIDAQLAVYTMDAAITGSLGATIAQAVIAKQAAATATSVTAKEAAVKIAQEATVKASKAASDAAAKASVQGLSSTELTAANQAAKKAAEELLEKEVAEKAAQTALREAIKKGEQQAAVNAAQNAVTTAKKDLAEKMASEKAAQTALKNSLEKGFDPAMRQGLDDALTKAASEKTLAENTLKKTTEQLAKDSQSLTTLKASQKAEKSIAQLETKADALASKPPTRLERASNFIKTGGKGNPTTKILDSADNPIIENQLVGQAQTSSESIAVNSTKTASQKAAEKQAAKLTEKINLLKDQQIASVQQQGAKASQEAAAKLATQSADDQIANKAAQDLIKKEAQILDDHMTATTKKQMDDAIAYADKKNAAAEKKFFFKKTDKMTVDQAIVKQEAKRIEGLTLSQQAQQFGLKKALSNNIKTGSFFLGQAVNGVLSIFGAIAAADQDQAAADQAEEEKKSIQTLWQFIEDTKVNVAQSQKMFLDELHKKHQVAVENRVFGLSYYKNFLNGSINAVQDQISAALAGQQIALLTPDANGLRSADIGSSWGLQTPFTYLYPAQGFISTTLGRPDFPYAQEVAQAPLTSQTTGAAPVDLSDNQPAATKLWFNQRAMTTLNQPADAPLDIEIKFRIIYTLTSAYHVGLYLGGNYHDYNSAAYLQQLKDQSRIDMNDAHLAKMFVLKREMKDTAPSLGLYENEGKGWIAQHPIDNKLVDTASIYHMSARLEKDQLTIAFWPENNPTEKWSQTMSVNPCDQRNFGVIFSGLAIEWNVVKPELKIQENKKARITSNGQSEIDREKASKLMWKKLMEPQFGFIKLQAMSKLMILQGKYIYTTQDTQLLDAQNNPINDYLVHASYDSASNQISKIGQSPQSTEDKSAEPNALVSLVTGNVYNSTRKIVSHEKEMLQTYTTKTKLPQDLFDQVSAAIESYNSTQQSQNQTPQATVQPQENSGKPQTISLADLMNATPPVTGGMQLGLTSAAPSQIVATPASISQLQIAAAGTTTVEHHENNSLPASSNPDLKSINQQPVDFKTSATRRNVPTENSALSEQNSTNSQSTRISSGFASDQFVLAGSGGLSL